MTDESKEELEVSRNRMAAKLIICGNNYEKLKADNDKLRKENVQLRNALVLILPLKADGTVDIIAIQRNFRIGFFEASKIADAVNESTASYQRKGEASHD